MIKISRDQKLFTKCKYIIDLYLSPLCNFKCDYCYVKSNYASTQNLPLKTALYFIDCISKAQNVNLSFLGGEPTLYKELNTVIDYAYNKVDELELYTNGSTDLTRLHLDKLKTVLSIHPRYYKRFRQRFLSNIEYLDKSNLNYQIRVVMENSDLSEIYNDLKDYQYLKEYIYSPTENYFILPDNFTEDKDFCIGDRHIGISEYVEKYFKPKKPYMCMMNSFVVLSNGDVEKYCSSSDLTVGNLFKNSELFKDLKIRLSKCKQYNTKGCSEMEIIRYL